MFRTCRRSEFKGKSRIGDYGDKLMEGDYHVGQILDALKDLGVDDDTFARLRVRQRSVGRSLSRIRQSGHAGHGQSGPFRGELGEATEGSIRTFAFIRWPGHVKPDTTSYAMFSIMDFFPTSPASSAARCRPTGLSTASTRATCCSVRARGHRDSLLSFIGPELVAVAMEAMARLFHRHSSDRHRAAAPARHWVQPTRAWPATRRSTTSRWTLMRI